MKDSRPTGQGSGRAIGDLSRRRSDLGWLNPAVFTRAAPIPGTYSDQFAAIATSVNIWVAAGLTEKGSKSRASGHCRMPTAAYDAGILINPQGQIVLHHRKFNVLQNAFDPAACQAILTNNRSAPTAGPTHRHHHGADATVRQDGAAGLLGCLTLYAPATALEKLKALAPTFVIVPWGITAGTQAECGTSGFDATGYAAQAATYLKSALLPGTNAVGPRSYGRFQSFGLLWRQRLCRAYRAKCRGPPRQPRELVLLTIPQSLQRAGRRSLI